MVDIKKLGTQMLIGYAVWRVSTGECPSRGNDIFATMFEKISVSERMVCANNTEYFAKWKKSASVVV